MVHFGAFCLLFIAPWVTWAAEDYDREATQKRIQPIGQVRIQGESDAAQTVAATEAKPETKKQQSGEQIYEKYCSVCHRAGVAGAPKFRDETDWVPRLAKADMTELVAIAMKGLNAMPPKGTCVECTEADLRAAITYMVPQHD